MKQFPNPLTAPELSSRQWPTIQPVFGSDLQHLRCSIQGGVEFHKLQVPAGLRASQFWFVFHSVVFGLGRIHPNREHERLPHMLPSRSCGRQKWLLTMVCDQDEVGVLETRLVGASDSVRGRWREVVVRSTHTCIKLLVEHQFRRPGRTTTVLVCRPRLSGLSRKRVSDTWRKWLTEVGASTLRVTSSRLPVTGYRSPPI